MATGLVIHISAGDDRHTEALSQDTIFIGPNDDCDVRIRASHLPQDYSPNGAMLELIRGNNSYRVKSFDQHLNFMHNDEPLELGARLVDGDSLHIADSDLALQFFFVSSLPMVVGRGGTQVAPFIENAAIESAATPKRDDAKIFLREFTRELVREINPSTKILTFLLAIALIGGILYIGLALYNEIKRTRQVTQDQKDIIAAQQKQIADISKQIEDSDKKNNQLRDTISLVPRLFDKYSKGVCLISGSYYFVESGTGRPLRYQETQYNENGEVIQNGDDVEPLTAEGDGAIAEYEFVGTGFYVGNGYVLTNRHVAQPWFAEERLMRVASMVKGVPRLQKIYAYFPEQQEPVALRYRISSSADDLAVCLIDNSVATERLPMLPLNQSESSNLVGKKVVLMGYPNGSDRLIAMLPENEAQMMRSRCGSSIETLLKCFASKNRIQPLTTEGIVTDADQRRIVHSAPTAQGGSGAPLFGQSEEVIGVSFAVFTENAASNFAVPIRYAINLLQRAGWKPPTHEDQKQAASTSPNSTAQNNTISVVTN